MTKTFRLGLLAVSGLAALAFTSVAMASFSPSLTITRTVNAGTGDTATDVSYAQAQADDPVARVLIYVPPGYSATINQTPGTQIGTLEGQVFADEISSVVPVTGPIVVGDKTSPQLQAAATACTGKADHDAIWVLNVSAAGSTLQVPAYVDALSGLPFTSASVSFCLSHPSQVLLHIRLLNATLHLANIFAPPAAPGSYRWTAVNTPWDSATPTLNAEGTIETQAFDRVPVDASFSAKRITKKRTVKHKAFTDIFYSYFVKVSGQVMAGGEPAASTNVILTVNGQKAANGTTDNDGTFTKTLKLTKTSTFSMQFERGSNPLVGATCDPRLPFPGTSVLIACGTITDGGFSVTTDEKTVVKPKLTHKRIKHKVKKKPKHKPKHKPHGHPHGPPR
jgi:hypothetical protein